MLRDLFNGALAHLVPDPVANPPVINAALDPSGVNASRWHAALRTLLLSMATTRMLQLEAQC